MPIFIIIASTIAVILYISIINYPRRNNNYEK